MLQPSPEFKKRLDQEQIVDGIEEKAKLLETWNHVKRSHKRTIRAITGLALLSVGLSAYSADVHANQELQANSAVGISILGGPLDKANNTHADVFLDGFGSVNADVLTRYMSKAVQPNVDGQLWSVDYNDAPLSYNQIADRIIATAEEQGVDSLSFDGYSAGGSLTAQVMVAISKKSSLQLDSVYFTSTPDGIRGLRPARQDEINTVEGVKWIPGAEYSTLIRFIGEMVFRAGNYTSDDNLFNNVGDFFNTAHDVFTSINNHDLPGTWLMFDQVLAIENANIKDRIAELGKISDTRVHPTIVYLGTAKPGYDYMVDNVKSSENIGNYAKKANLPYFVLNVPGAVHTRPDLANDEYIKTLASAKEEIQDSINNQISIAYGNLLTERYKNAPKIMTIDPNSVIAAPADQ